MMTIAVLTYSVSILCENLGGKIFSPTQHLAKRTIHPSEQVAI